MRINGSAIEALFDYEAMSRGLRVSTPVSAMSVYDKIVDTGKNIYRVQVKSRGKTNHHSIYIRANGRTRPYQIEDVDILAVYLDDSKSWYFYHIEDCKPSFRINLKKDNLPENNWSIFV